MTFGRRGAAPASGGPKAAPAPDRPQNDSGPSPAGDLAPGLGDGLAVRILLALAPAAFAYLLPIVGVVAWMVSGLDAFKPFQGLLTTAPYLSLALLGWALGYPNASRMTAISVGLLIIYGFVTPIVINGAVQLAVAQIPTRETPGLASMKEPHVVAVLTTEEDPRTDRAGMEQACGLLCQRLLFKGSRTAVLAGATPRGGDPSNATGLTRYWVEQRDRCPEVVIPPAGALEGENSVLGTAPTSEFTQREVARGRCLLSGPGSIAEADTVTMADTRMTIEQSLAAERVGGGVIKFAQAVFHRRGQGWSLVARARTLRYETAAAPLQLRLVLGGTLIQGSRNTRGPHESMIQRVLRPWLGADLSDGYLERHNAP